MLRPLNQSLGNLLSTTIGVLLVLFSMMSVKSIAQTITEYSSGISNGAVLSGITAAQDGAVWFTEYGGNRIGRIDPTTHAIVEYSSGISSFAGLGAATVGTDGAIWFVEAGRGTIGRIDLRTQTVKEFST